MTRDDIIRMLQECGFGTLADHPIMTENMVRFAALVAAAEREEILKLTDSLGWVDSAAIRARGKV